MVKLDEPFRDKDIFGNLSFLQFIIGFWEQKIFVCHAVFGWYFAPWIPIQVAKNLPIRL